MEQRFNPFGDEPRDRNNCVRWLTKHLNRLMTSIMDQELESEIEDYLDELEMLDKFLDENSQEPESDYADIFLDKIHPIYEWTNQASIERFKQGLSWGEWRSEDRRTLRHGHSDCHEKTVIREKSSTAVHYYNCIPEPLVWDCIPVEQHDQTFYLVIAKVSELNAICSVPSFSKTLQTGESGLRVLDRKREPREWQRNPDTSRINGIETFIGDKRNLVANTPLVFAPESDYVTYERDADGTVKRATISFDFLDKQGDSSYSDHIGLEDRRPLWLIDGQHRVRGISQNPISTELEIPFVFFPDDLSVNFAAKIFAEVNTLARELSDLHKLFMRHRFQLPSHNHLEDFRPLVSGIPEEANSWKNTMSYECAAFLTSSPGSPLKSLIQILDENIEGNHIIDAKMFMKFSRSWFDKKGPYNRDCGLEKEEIFEEIRRYFLAIEAVFNHLLFGNEAPEEWEDGEFRWKRNPPKTGGSGIQTPRNFRALLVTLPVVLESCSGEDRPYTKSQLERALSPLSWVDWNSSEFKKKFVNVTGEIPWKGLAEWIRNAIIEGTIFPIDEVMTDEEEFESLAGRGILCRPKQPEIRLDDASPLWPSKGSPVVLVSERPMNTLPTSKWYIRDAKGNPRNQKVNSKVGADGICRYEIKYETWMNNNQITGVSESMTVNVEWRNGFVASGGELLLPNPG